MTSLSCERWMPLPILLTMFDKAIPNYLVHLHSHSYYTISKHPYINNSMKIGLQLDRRQDDITG